MIGHEHDMKCSDVICIYIYIYVYMYIRVYIHPLNMSAFLEP